MSVDVRRLQELFAAALELHDPAQRSALLESECGEDATLRRKVELLLAAHDDSQGLPAADPGLTVPHVPLVPPAGMQPGRVIAGRYKLLEEIGEGGMGTVWVAEQSTPVKRKVALKLIKAGLDSKAVLARFEAERQALALMDHPNIAKVLDGGITDGEQSVISSGRPFFVMEYLKGVPITQYCDATRLSVSGRLQLFAQVCSAVQHAHQKGIIHRDLKPSNILVVPYDDKPVPKVIDFGLAKAMYQPLTDRTLHTAHDVALGTPLYMSPEQAQLNNLDIDTRSDIYALGVLLYELLTGTTPLERGRFKKAAWNEILRVIREEEPLRPSARLSSAEALPSLAACRQTEPVQLTRQVRGDLDWIAMKALEKDRTRRYETANGLALDVQRYLAGEPVLAAPPSTTYRLRKWARKHRVMVLAASAVLLTLLVGIAGTTWGLLVARQATAEERLAKEQTQRRLAQIEKGVDLFAGLLRGLNPRNEELGGPPLYEQLRQRAANAADELISDAVGDPESVARLQNWLGVTLLDLGDANKAIELLGRATETNKILRGVDHPDTLSALRNLAGAYGTAGKGPEAIALCEHVRDAQVKQLGADHPETLLTLHNLAGEYVSAGRLPEAIALFEGVRDARIKKLGADHGDTINTLQTLASAYRAAGRLREAIRIFEAVRDARFNSQGAEHPDTLNTLSSLAHAYQMAGRLPEAITLFEQVRDAQVKKLGAEHPATQNTLNGLGLAYHAAGRFPEAIALFSEVRDAQIKKLGADHPHILTTLNNLAFAYHAAGRMTEATNLFEQVRVAQIKRIGADHPIAITTLNNLARAYMDTGKLEQALPLFAQAATGVEKLRFQHEFAAQILSNTVMAYEKAKQFGQAEAWQRKWLAAVKERAGAESPAYALELAVLGKSLLQQQRWMEAEASFKECLNIRQKAEPDLWSTFHTMSLLGEALMGQKKYVAAEPLLTKGFEGMMQRMKQIPPAAKSRPGEAADRLITLYEAIGKPAEAAKWRKERKALELAAAAQGAKKK